MTVFTPDLLANGQVANSEGAIYTCPASTRAMIKTVTFVNTSATPQTVVLYVRESAGTSRRVFQWIMSQYQTGVYGESIALNAGDTLRAVSTTNNVVDFTVHGVEQA